MSYVPVFVLHVFFFLFNTVTNIILYRDFINSLIFCLLFDLLSLNLQVGVSASFLRNEKKKNRSLTPPLV